MNSLKKVKLVALIEGLKSSDLETKLVNAQLLDKAAQNKDFGDQVLDRPKRERLEFEALFVAIFAILQEQTSQLLTPLLEILAVCCERNDNKEFAHMLVSAGSAHGGSVAALILVLRAVDTSCVPRVFKVIELVFRHDTKAAGAFLQPEALGCLVELLAPLETKTPTLTVRAGSALKILSFMLKSSGISGVTAAAHHAALARSLLSAVRALTARVPECPEDGGLLTHISSPMTGASPIPSNVQGVETDHTAGKILNSPLERDALSDCVDCLERLWACKQPNVLAALARTQLQSCAPHDLVRWLASMLRFNADSTTRPRLPAPLVIQLLKILSKVVASSDEGARLLQAYGGSGHRSGNLIARAVEPFVARELPHAWLPDKNPVARLLKVAEDALGGLQAREFGGDGHPGSSVEYPHLSPPVFKASFQAAAYLAELRSRMPQLFASGSASGNRAPATDPAGRFGSLAAFGPAGVGLTASLDPMEFSPELWQGPEAALKAQQNAAALAAVPFRCVYAFAGASPPLTRAPPAFSDDPSIAPAVPGVAPVPNEPVLAHLPGAALAAMAWATRRWAHRTETQVVYDRLTASTPLESKSDPAWVTPGFVSLRVVDHNDPMHDAGFLDSPRMEPQPLPSPHDISLSAAQAGSPTADPKQSPAASPPASFMPSPSLGSGSGPRAIRERRRLPINKLSPRSGGMHALDFPPPLSLGPSAQRRNSFTGSQSNGDGSEASKSESDGCVHVELPLDGDAVC
jgi:hypothetical protein